tara:strand:+ start:323 stop:505 length:183 start_codon:yes stop_codon:yes gene_type:complete
MITPPPPIYTLVSIVMCMAYFFVLSKIDREERMSTAAFWFALFSGAIFICLALRLVAFKF